MPIDTSTSSARAAKFESVGDKIEGTILSADAKPQTDIDTGEIKTWSDGNPILQWVIVLATSLRFGSLFFSSHCPVLARMLYFRV